MTELLRAALRHCLLGLGLFSADWALATCKIDFSHFPETTQLVSRSDVEENIEYLRRQLSQIPGWTAEQGLFGPQSVVWKVFSENATKIGMGRALLFQLADPKVAEALNLVGRVQAHALDRFKKTSNIGAKFIFSDFDTIANLAKHLQSVHEKSGQMVSESGKDSSYRCNSRSSQRWVLATLAEGALHSYERFVGKLSPVEKDRYVEEFNRLGGLMGLAPSELPKNYAQFSQYFSERSSQLSVGPAASTIATNFLSEEKLSLMAKERGFPGAPFLSRYFRFVVAKDLPPDLRKAYGLPDPKRLSGRALDWLTSTLAFVYQRAGTKYRMAPTRMQAEARLKASSK